jgi:Fe-S-cluster containining protein
MYQTNLQFIAAAAIDKEEENDHFLLSVRAYDNAVLEAMVHEMNNTVSAGIDCTACGNCCKTLVINVTQEEVGKLAEHMHMSEVETRENYIEESLAGNCFINTMPCHFLADDKCTIYEARFTECRDFPHLHKPGFKARLAGTLMHYGRCPIIYNVVEEMKVKTGFLLDTRDA